MQVIVEIFKVIKMSIEVIRDHYEQKPGFKEKASVKYLLNQVFTLKQIAVFSMHKVIIEIFQF